MSRKQKRASKFTKISTSGHSLSSLPLAPPLSQVAQWYRGTSEMPLSRFIKAAVNLDLNQLVISGTPSVEELASAWSNIYQEFIDGMQDKKADYRVRLLNDIDKLEYNYRVIQMCVQRLSFGPSDWAIAQLRRRVRVSGEFNPEDQAQYYQNLLIVMNQALSLKHQLAERQAELKIVYQRAGSGGQLSYEQFDHLVTRVCLFAKFQINRKETMVSEFISLYKEMKATEDALRQQLETSKARR